jgi:RNA polymerase sigma factor (sigma-70 family)
MISANYKLVVSICRKYVGYGMALGDLINEGISGLVKGVERFEPSKGCKFSTYAHWWIRQAVTRSLQEQGRLVRWVLERLLVGSLHVAAAVARAASQKAGMCARQPVVLLLACLLLLA